MLHYLSKTPVFCSISRPYLSPLNSNLTNVSQGTIHKSLTGSFVFSKNGHVCVGCGTLVSTTEIPNYSEIVKDLPAVYDDKSYVGAFITDSAGYNSVYNDDTRILNRNKIQSGVTLRLLTVYLCR